MEKLRLSYVQCNRVSKEELPGLINGVVKLLDKHDPEKYFVNNRYKELQELVPDLGELNAVSRKSSITDSLVDQYIYRDKLLYTMFTNYKSIQRAKVVSQVEDLQLVKLLLEDFLVKAQKGVTEKKAEFIGQMTKTMSNNIKLNAALSSLGLAVYMSELSSVQASISLNIEDRSAYLGNLPRQMTKTAKVNSGATLQNLFSGLKLAMLDHPELDFSPLINEMNQLIIMYKSRIKSRETIRMNSQITKRAKVSDAKTAVVLTTTSNTTTVSEN